MSLLAHVITLLGGSGLPDQLPDDPMPLLQKWLEEACVAAATPNPNAITLATASLDGHPSARIVLCKEIQPQQRSVIFFTNYDSRKGRELMQNPHAAAVFHFDATGRQARVEGTVERLSATESDAYFSTRTTLSKLGAWASKQSKPIKSRLEFAENISETMRTFGINPLTLLTASIGTSQPEIPRPENWGGIRLIAHRVELWSSSQGRLHDRAEWTLRDNSNQWIATRLQP